MDWLLDPRRDWPALRRRTVKSIDLLKSVDVLSKVPEEDLAKITWLLKESKVSKGDVVFRQGEAGDALYIVTSGRIKCSRLDLAGGESVQDVFSDGDAFGEMSLLTGEPRSVTAQAVTDTKLLLLRKDDFDGFLAGNVEVMRHMMKIISQRQTNDSERMAQGEYSDAFQPMGRVFTIFSPKGGVGKSTIAVNLAVELARTYLEQVVLLDLSLVFGHDMLMLNLSPKSSLAATNGDALRKMGGLEDISYYLSTHPTSTLRVFAGATRPEDGETVTGDTAKAAIQQLRRHFKYVVIDTGSYYSDPVLAALENSDRLVVVCSPEMSTLQDIRDSKRILSDVVHIKRDKICYILNHIFPFKTLSRDQFESALQQELYMEIPYGGEVPAKAALLGEAFVEKQSGSNVGRAIQKLAKQLVTETTGTGEPAHASGDRKRGFFR
jgi:MinD-like ATPase involved in chromosome partitioning or flagellar assembly